MVADTRVSRQKPYVFLEVWQQRANVVIVRLTAYSMSHACHGFKSRKIAVKNPHKLPFQPVVGALVENGNKILVIS